MKFDSRFYTVHSDSPIAPAAKVYQLTWKCGHGEVIRILHSELQRVQSLDASNEAYDYQKTGIQWLLERGGTGFIADAMGLGKTIEGLLTIRNLPNEGNWLVVVKSATTYQWIREFKHWTNKDDLGIFMISGSKGFIAPGFKTYVISMDTLGRNGTWKKLLGLGITGIIIDEAHSFKDSGSARTQALVNFIKASGVKYKIPMTGTPIKNRAGEWFTGLNIVAPSVFPSEKRFKDYWIDDDGKRIKPWKLEEFRRTIEPYVLRREKLDVQHDLPPLTRNYQYVVLDDPAIKNSYNRQLDLFQNALNSQSGLDSFSILGWLSTLRRITGKAKIPLATDFIEEFLENTDDKLAIGIQHKDVRDLLHYSLQKYNPLKLSGEDSAFGKDRIIESFKREDRRVLILNELAGGVGLNIQFCSNVLVLERQWNSADEEQFESRFHRNGQERPVISDYLIAKGTIDEYFHDMVEEKRKIFGETIQGWEFTSDLASIRDLAAKTIQNKL